MILRKKKLSPTERYFQTLARENLPWRVLKALAIVLFVGFMTFVIYEHSREDSYGYKTSGSSNLMNLFQP
jgi:hypothetical protein